MKVVAIIQARMGSNRLPGKVLKDLCGKSVLGHVVERVKACELVDKVVVATTELSADDKIVDECGRYSYAVFRGSEDDVLARYYHAACESRASVVVRVTSDCPLFDPDVLMAMLRRFLEAQKSDDKPDYLSNTILRTFPRGLDTEVFTFQALATAFSNATDSWEREHVTPYIYRHPELFGLENFVAERDCSTHRWTLDTFDDWRFIEAVYSALKKSRAAIRTEDVFDLLKARPEIFELNAHVEQKKAAS